MSDISSCYLATDHGLERMDKNELEFEQPATLRWAWSESEQAKGEYAMESSIASCSTSQALHSNMILLHDFVVILDCFVLDTEPQTRNILSCCSCAGRSSKA